MINYRTFKYLLLPNKKQAKMIDTNINLCAFLRKTYKKDLEEKNVLSKKATDILKAYIHKYPELDQCDYLSLINIVFSVNNERTHNTIIYNNAFRFNYTDRLKKDYPFSDERIYINKIGWIKKKNNRAIPEGYVIKTLVVVRQTDNKYYLLVNAQKYIDEKEKKQPLDINKTIGFDYSSADFIVDSNGEKHKLIKQYQKYENKIIQYQKKMDKCQKDSIQYNNTKRLFNKTFKKIVDSRNDALHKLSTEMAEKYDYIVVETLDIKEIVKVNNLGKNTFDNSYARFIVLLEYKMNDRNKKLIKIDRWFPSSKLCHVCGYKNQELSLETRSWVCPNCGTLLDRDVNAYPNFYKIQTFKNIVPNIGSVLS